MMFDAQRHRFVIRMSSNRTVRLVPGIAPLLLSFLERWHARRPVVVVRTCDSGTARTVAVRADVDA
jgi:hypothetical protein